MFNRFISTGALRGLLIAYGTYCAAIELRKLGENLLKKKKTEEDDNDQLSTLEERKTEEGDSNNNQLSTLEERKPSDLWNTAIFFPDYSLSINPDSPTAKLIKLIDGAKVTIRICMFCCSYGPLVSAIIRKHRQGLIVQIVSNKRARMGKIATRVYRPPADLFLSDPARVWLMHNKFVLIDDEAVLTGSLNWTREGVTSNQENVIVSTDPRHVKPYLDRFVQLWDMIGSSEEGCTRKKI